MKTGYLRTKRVQQVDLEEGLVAVAIQGIDVDGKTTVVSFESLTPEAGSIHNELEGIQGGKIDEYYHLDKEKYDKLTELLHVDNISSIKTNPVFGEKGKETSVSLSYKIESKDDIINTASIDNGVGDVLASVNQPEVTVSVGNLKETKTYKLSLGFKRNENNMSSEKTATYTAYIPQFAGAFVASDGEFGANDFHSYPEIDRGLTKYVQQSASISKQSSPSNQYIWFISNKENAKIYDQNNFQQTVGAWGNGSTEFYTKEKTIALYDGTTMATYYFYRSRGVKTLTDFTYKIQ